MRFFLPCLLPWADQDHDGWGWRSKEAGVCVYSPCPLVVWASQDHAHLYLVLSFAGGGDLFALLERRGRLSEEAARFYAAEMVLALEALHQALVVYRELRVFWSCLWLCVNKKNEVAWLIRGVCAAVFLSE